MALGVLISCLPLNGSPSVNQVFGFYGAPSSVQIQRVQITSQTAPVGGNVTIELINASGTSLGISATLAAATTYVNYAVPTPLTLAANATVRARVTAIDNGTAEDLFVNLIGATSQGPQAPGGGNGCCGGSPEPACLPPQGTMLFFAGSAQVEQAAAAASAAAAANSAASAASSASNAGASALAAATSATAAGVSATNAAASSTSAGSSAAAANASATAAGASASNASASATSAAASAAAAVAARPYTVRVHRTSDLTVADVTETPVTWEVEDFDDDSMWAPANPTRLTPPANTIRVRLTAGIRWEDNTATAYRNVKIKANNAAGYYALNAIMASDSRPPDGAPGASSCTLTTGWLDIQNINYFELTVEQDSGGALDIWGTAGAQPGRGWGTFFQMEVLK